MDYFRVLSVLAIALPVAWSAYEAFRMRRHRLKTDLLMSVTTCTLVNLDKRLTLAVQNDQVIAETLQRISRPADPANPADGGRP
jgi:hypothetical protein